MSTAGVGGHTDRGTDESARKPREEGEREDSGIFLRDFERASRSLAESRLSISNAIMSRRV